MDGRQYAAMGWLCKFRTSGVSECNHPYRASPRALTGFGAANSHIPGEFMSCLTCHGTLYRSQGERSVITTMQASTHEYHMICSLHKTHLTAMSTQNRLPWSLSYIKETGPPQISNRHTGGATRGGNMPAGDSCTVVVGQSCPDQTFVECTRHKTCAPSPYTQAHVYCKHLAAWYPDLPKSTSSLCLSRQ